MSPRERTTTLTPQKRLKVILPEPFVSEEAKEAFLMAYNELEENYLRLQLNLAHYLVNAKKPNRLN